jgi:hypothetical protein
VVLNFGGDPGFNLEKISKITLQILNLKFLKDFEGELPAPNTGMKFWVRIKTSFIK